MRVVHIVDRVDTVGGVQSYLRLLVPGLVGRGVESALVTETDVGGDSVGAACHTVPGLQHDGPSPSAETAAALHGLLEELAPDLCIVHTAPSPGVGGLAAAHAPTLAYAHDYAMVCPGNARFLHRTGAFCEEGPGLRCFRRAYTERCTNRRPDRILRASRRTRAWPDVWSSLARILVASPFVAGVLSADGAPDDLLRVVAYPVATPTPVEPEPAGDVLYLGRVVASKGVEMLLRALAGLEGVSLTVAGDGPDRSRLEALAAELRLDVRFLGWVGPERRAALLRGSRVFAMPSLWPEAFGIAGVEALAAGVPVVGSAVGGIPSWLEDGRGGLLVPPGDADALREALRRVLGEPELAAELAAAGPAAAARFSLAAHLDLLVPELEAVVQPR